MSLTERFRSSPLPAVVVPQAITAERAQALRARLEAAPYVRTTRIDRARLDEVASLDRTDFADVLEAIAGIASAVTGRALAVVDARALRLGPGDFALVGDDRVHDGRPVEVTLDVSAEAIPDAEVHYRHRGQVYFTFDGPPGALAVVERAPTVLCNHTYVSRRYAPAAVVRLVVRLQET